MPFHPQASPARRIAAAVAVCAMVAPISHAVASEGLQMTLTDTGQREYYCQATFELVAPESAEYQDINGFFYVFVGDEQVGRSKGASFQFPDGQNTASATFETPNAPCDDVDRYVFVVGACMQGGGFVNRAECAETITGAPLVSEVRAR